MRVPPTVSFLEVPAFDALEGQAEPFAGFGQPLAGPALGRDFESLVGQAWMRVNDGLWPSPPSFEDVPLMLDATISEMWETGWDPEAGDLNLFVRDFGAVLTASVRHMWGGELVFRSTYDVSHLSVWWPEARFEAFSFHKVLKALHQREGESLTLFARGVGQHVSGARQ